MVLLGSTGSIGVNTIKIAQKFNTPIEVLSAGYNIELLNKQIEIIKPKIVVVASQDDVSKVAHDRVYSTQDGIIRAIEESKSNLVVNAIVGFAGLKATIKANQLGKKIALANKESLVVAGKFINISNIFPIDSEHFGLWYLLQNRPINKMIITASGGAFRDWDIQDIKNATLEDTQRHPNWSMGEKITIDSATMVNKLFEVLEAYWLYGSDSIDAIIETKSIIHSMIDFKDGSTTAHLAQASMQLPIAFALNQEMNQNIVPNVDMLKIGSLEFKEIELQRYPVWKLKDRVLKNPQMGVVINSANEAIIDLFIQSKVKFTDISTAILDAYDKFVDIKVDNIDDIFKIDKEVREWIYKNY